MDIKLIALDLDDTLLDSRTRISPRSAAAIRRAVAQGITVTVATGRMFRSALPFARQLGLDVPLITYDGALVKAALSGQTYFCRPLPPDLAAEVLKLFRHNNWHIQAYVDDVLYVRERDAAVKTYERIAGIQAVPVGDELWNLAGSPVKLLAIDKPETIRKIEASLAGKFGERLYTAVSKPAYLEIVNCGVNKGRALAWLAGRLGLEREQVMAVGDSNNDLDMIEYAGLGVAMGNAAPAVKAAAQAVTRGNDEDGVAEAIERWALNIER